MHHPDLKSLVWGRQLQRLLAAFGVHPTRPEPAPRLVGRVPIWFQRLGAALTVLGLVAAVRVLDRAVLSHPTERVDQAELAAWDTSAWNEWADGLHFRLNPFALATLEPTSAEARTTEIETKAPAASVTAPARTSAESPGVPHRFRPILVTAYSSTNSETDPSPEVTATNTRAKPGTIALSRDLLRSFTPGAPFDFGEKVLIPGVGIFEVRDTMNERWQEKADIWFASVRQAKSWGRRTVFVTRVEDNAPTIAFTAQ
jgi:3D (Asp-Asp-Asp) domain-containing protein